MSEATIVLTVKTGSASSPEHLAPLIAAAAEGFKVDGWEVVETQGIWGQPFVDSRCGCFEHGDGVTVAPYVEGVSFLGLDPDNRTIPHGRSGEAVVEAVDPSDGTVQVRYTDPALTNTAASSEWVHHTSLALR
jgi:hypothetical protein